MILRGLLTVARPISAAPFPLFNDLVPTSQCFIIGVGNAKATT